MARQRRRSSAASCHLCLLASVPGCTSPQCSLSFLTPCCAFAPDPNHAYRLVHFSFALLVLSAMAPRGPIVVQSGTAPVFFIDGPAVTTPDVSEPVVPVLPAMASTPGLPLCPSFASSGSVATAPLLPAIVTPTPSPSRELNSSRSTQTPTAAAAASGTGLFVSQLAPRVVRLSPPSSAARGTHWILLGAAHTEKLSESVGLSPVTLEGGAAAPAAAPVAYPASPPVPALLAVDLPPLPATSHPVRGVRPVKPSAAAARATHARRAEEHRRGRDRARGAPSSTKPAAPRSRANRGRGRLSRERSSASEKKADRSGMQEQNAAMSLAGTAGSRGPGATEDQEAGIDAAETTEAAALGADPRTRTSWAWILTGL